MIVIAGFILGPFIPLLIQSFAFRWAWPDLLPSTWWLEQRDKSMLPLAWDYVFSPYSRVWEATVNTVFIGSVVTVICLAICLPAARVLARERFRGKSAFEFFLSLPLIVPEAAIGIALLMIFIRLGLAGSYVGIIIAHLIPTIPYMVRMLTAVYQGLGRDFEEQAMILGANRRQILWRVTLPMLLPGVVAGALFTFLVSTNIFLLTFFLGQGQIVTLPTLLFSKISGGTLDASAAGITLIVTLPGIILLILSERFIKEEAFGKGFGN
ncbi:ABC transporter permease subunit [Nitratireductor sp. CAU 1489]|uniref:ABC transporter permease subunit n=1 Tax=Nitratireductor arenosus TaxID=2682096 RepID=A0A844QDD6_9HYPH|nr:ABC transporter permease subunit [Nitratireductor arenosus]PSM17663.1 ABC transporter permease [Nitratireductor sp. StC3]